MYAVIFRAQIGSLDDSYLEMAYKMRALAMNKFNCLEFSSLSEGSDEISISYWKSLDAIALWKKIQSIL